ncbi:MAG: hypothetical protein ISS72_11000 [Candidatus Brocadiae bacterium]|nr:hypothetical protein [Candidatus Brocadiia bacterium]
MLSKNLFAVLSRYGGSQGAENYLTESFCYVLRYLLDHEPHAAINILNCFCGESAPFCADEGELVAVQTQRPLLTGGIPDITITAPGVRIVIEVKYDSPPYAEKLSGYRRALDACEESCKRLVLLTRWWAEIEPGPDGPHECLRWYQVHDWLTGELTDGHVRTPVGTYIVTEFKQFLEERGMAIERVSWELALGVSELAKFITMLDLALERADLKGSMGNAIGTQTYYGRMIDSPRYWCGISYERPLYLFFQVCGCPGEMKEQLQKLYPDEYDGGFKLFLEDESSCFFVHTKDRQLDMLAGFIRQSYDRVKQAERAVADGDDDT